MRRVVPLPSFERSVKRLSPQDKKKLVEGLEKFNQFLVSGQPSPGLGFKKINHDKYEIRVDIRIRVVLKAEGDAFYLVLAGNHDEVRQYLRDFR